MFYRNRKKTSLSQDAAFRTSAGSCLPESARDPRDFHHTSLCFSRNCPPASSKQRPTPRLKGIAVIEIWGVPNDSLADSYSSWQETTEGEIEGCSWWCHGGCEDVGCARKHSYAARNDSRGFFVYSKLPKTPKNRKMLHLKRGSILLMQWLHYRWRNVLY